MIIRAVRAGAAQTALAAFIYWPTLQLAFVSETWTYLLRLRHGLWPTLTMATGYNYQPVAIAWIAAIRACFGESAAAFQAVNVGQIVLLAALTAALGRRLLEDSWLGFLGSLLVIGSVAFYEAAYWPLAGNMHLLGANLYVLAVIVAWDMGRGGCRRWGKWLLAAVILAAVFTHPAMIPALAVCVVTLFLADQHGRTDGTPSLLTTTARTARRSWPLLIVVVLFAASQLTFAGAIEGGPQPGLDPMRAYWLLSRGVVAVFSLRGSHDVLHSMITLGTNATPETTRLWLYVGGWLIAASVIGAISWWRTRRPGLRVLIAFMAIHAVTVAAAGGMSSRESHVLAVPAALLTAALLHAAGRRVGALVAPSGTGAVGYAVTAAGVGWLIAAAYPDHVTAAAVHIRAAGLSRALVEEITRQSLVRRDPMRLTLVNMPAYTIERNIGAITFSNGLEALSRINVPALGAFQLGRIDLPGAPALVAARSVPMDIEGLRARVAEPHAVVVLFTMPASLVTLTPDAIDRLTSH